MGNILGISDKDLSEVGESKTIIGVLQNFGNKLQTDLRKSLQSKINTVTPKSLEQSIIFDIKVLGSVYKFELLMEDYWKFVDKGVQGAGGIKKDGSLWLSKNITSPFKFGSGNFAGTGKQFKISVDRWANNNGVNPFMARQSIFHKGTKATNFYSSVVDDSLIKELAKDLEAAGAREIEISLKNGLDGNSN